MNVAEFEFWLVTGLTVVCTGVFVASAVVLVGAAMTAKGLELRARTLEPTTLLAKLEAAPSDLQRIAKAFEAMPPLLLRGVFALERIATSLGALRASARAMRDAFF